jgi:hypothetical protein
MARATAGPIVAAESGLTCKFEEIQSVPMLKRQQECAQAKGWCERRMKNYPKFQNESGHQSCALVATSSSASAINRRKITHTST